MKPSKILWTVAALLVLGVGFVLDRTVLDDDPTSSTDGATQDDDTTDVDDDAAAGADSDDPVAGDGPDDVGDPATDGPSADSSSDTVEERGPPPRFSDLPIVTLDELPSEALDTLELIEAGGPYPYGQDDSTFQNREGILPDRDHGHYREYTVETPGSSDRGARRIVAGADGERYWTDDHYDSFSEIQF